MRMITKSTTISRQSLRHSPKTNVRWRWLLEQTYGSTACRILRSPSIFSVHKAQHLKLTTEEENNGKCHVVDTLIEDEVSDRILENRLTNEKITADRVLRGLR